MGVCTNGVCSKPPAPLLAREAQLKPNWGFSSDVFAVGEHPSLRDDCASGRRLCVVSANLVLATAARRRQFSWVGVGCGRRSENIRTCKFDQKAEEVRHVYVLARVLVRVLPYRCVSINLRNGVFYMEMGVDDTSCDHCRKAGHSQSKKIHARFFSLSRM